MLEHEHVMLGASSSRFGCCCRSGTELDEEDEEFLSGQHIPGVEEQETDPFLVQLNQRRLRPAEYALALAQDSESWFVTQWKGLFNFVYQFFYFASYLLFHVSGVHTECTAARCRCSRCVRCGRDVGQQNQPEQWFCRRQFFWAVFLLVAWSRRFWENICIHQSHPPALQTLLWSAGFCGGSPNACSCSIAGSWSQDATQTCKCVTTNTRWSQEFAKCTSQGRCSGNVAAESICLCIGWDIHVSARSISCCIIQMFFASSGKAWVGYGAVSHAVVWQNECQHPTWRLSSAKACRQAEFVRMDRSAFCICCSNWWRYRWPKRRWWGWYTHFVFKGMQWIRCFCCQRYAIN